MRPLLPPVLQPALRPLRSWWKQEWRERVAWSRRRSLAALLLAGLGAALLIRTARNVHLPAGEGPLLLELAAVLLAALLAMRARSKLARRRQLRSRKLAEQRELRQLSKSCRSLDAMLSQLGSPAEANGSGPANGARLSQPRPLQLTQQLNQRLEWMVKSARSLALVDGLTQLPNRRHFIEQVQIEAARAQRASQRFAVLFIDIDRFKAINDTYGHATGDRALIAVADRLRDSMRAGDVLCRLGGDEFAVLMDLSTVAHDSRQTLQAHAHLFACRLLGRFDEQAQLGNVNLDIAISIGVSVVDPESSDPETILRQADLAMEQAKRQQHTRVAVFDLASAPSSEDDYQLYADLRQTVREGGLLMTFQPIVDARQQLQGVEALARWQHPSRGWISPEKFINLAEHYRMMRELGDHLFQLSLDGYQQLRQAINQPQLRLSTNISPSQLGDPQLRARLLGMLERAGVDPALVTLEITEVAILERTATTEANLAALRQAGIALSLDDFGTGYSSLNLINSLQPNEIKIDRSFVMALHSDAYARQIVEVIAGMSSHMGLQLVAEGVEDEATFHTLRDLGIHRFQGYWFSRPLPVAELCERWSAG